MQITSILLLVMGCSGAKYLQKNEKLLTQQTIVAPKGFITTGMESLYVQKSNRRLLIFPINPSAWIYHWGKKKYTEEKFQKRKDEIENRFTKKINATSDLRKKENLLFRKKKKIDDIDFKIDNGNNLMQWGDKISVYDSLKIKATVDRLNVFLSNKGYFRGHVSAKIKTNRHNTYVKYFVHPGPLYKIDSIEYLIPDANVASLIKNNRKESLIQLNTPYDQTNLVNETERIEFFLKDHGYYTFSRHYIQFAVDTFTQKKHRIKISIELLNAAQENPYKQYTIDSINFTTDAGIKNDEAKRISQPYKKVVFHYFEPEFSKRILEQRVFIDKDSVYSRTKTFNTQRRIANLDMFKFVNINYEETEKGLIANIFTSKLDKYAWSKEAGVTITQGFPGPYLGTSFKKRNVFGGLETLELSGRFGFEGVASATQTSDFYRSTEAIGSASLIFPQFLLPFTKLASSKFAKYNPYTRILTGYTYTDRPEYLRSITNLTISYTWDINQKFQFSFSPTNLNIINSNISSDFEKILIDLAKKGNNLYNAFLPSFVSSMLFSITWNNNYGKNDKNSTLIRWVFESGGTLLNFYTPGIIKSEGLEEYKYLRINLDYRRNRYVNTKSSIAYRMNVGLGYAYSDNKILPYEKNFFAGGSNSIRAWKPRRLGLGNESPPLSDNPSTNGYYDYSFEKPGDFLVEGSIEWRQKLFAFINYAIFLDAGNVWSIQSNIDESARFKIDSFYKSIAVGTGFGLRFDFTFLILRFDVGMKVWDPARPESERFVLWKNRFTEPYGINTEPVIYNVGIGYPF